MVTVLQLNRMELKDMILNEIAENPVLEEAADGAEELTPAEVQSILERERQTDPADQAILDKVEAGDSLQAFDSSSDGDRTGRLLPDNVGEVAAAAQQRLKNLPSLNRSF